MSKAACILRAMRERLRESRFWVQGTWCGLRDARYGHVTPLLGRDVRGGNCWCLGEALTLACKELAGDEFCQVRSDVELKLLAIIERRGGDTWSNVAPWNDNPKTSHADVMSVLDQALIEEAA